MGEIADAVIGGFYCQECGQYIDGKEPGYPRICKDCIREENNKANKRRIKERRIKDGV